MTVATVYSGVYWLSVGLLAIGMILLMTSAASNRRIEALGVYLFILGIGGFVLLGFLQRGVAG